MKKEKRKKDGAAKKIRKAHDQVNKKKAQKAGREYKPSPSRTPNLEKKLAAEQEKRENKFKLGDLFKKKRADEKKEYKPFLQRVKERIMGVGNASQSEVG